MFGAFNHRVLRNDLRSYLLGFMGLLTLLLTGCQNVQDSLYDTAINFERSRADLKLEHITAGDIDFALLQGGKSNGETILMVHGFGADKNNWLRVAQELKDSYHIIAVDLAGHGESSLHTNTHGQALDYLIPSQADRLNTLLQTLELDKVHYMGSSMGGAIGLQFAARYPERLHSLVLLNNAGIESPQVSEYFQLLDQGENPLIAKQPGDFEVLIDFVTAEKPFIPWPISAVLERRALARSALNEQIFADMKQSRSDMGSPDQINHILTTIETPSLVIWGDKDRVLDVSSIDVMEKHMPQLTAVILPGVGHVPMLEAPEKVGEAFKSFASQLPQ